MSFVVQHDFQGNIWYARDNYDGTFDEIYNPSFATVYQNEEEAKIGLTNIPVFMNTQK